MTQAYPPPEHVLRDLDFDAVVAGEAHHRATYRPAGAGSTALGGLLTVIDVLAGTVCMRAIAPDWMATSGLTFHLCGPLPADMLEIDAHLLRAGRTTVTIEVLVEGPGGRPVGEGVVTFARLVRRDTNLFLDDADHTRVGARIEFPTDRARPVGRGRSLLDAIGCEVVDAARGLTRTPMSPYVRNSFGAMNGGVVAGLVEAAALAGTQGSAVQGPAVQGSAVQGSVVQDVAIHYLTQGKVGPIETRVRPLRSEVGHSSVRVEVIDAGAAERTMAVAHVGVSTVTGSGIASGV